MTQMSLVLMSMSNSAKIVLPIKDSKQHLKMLV